MALYLIANLDRTSLGNAKIEGLEADLKMTGNDYNIANMMFFILYILCEIPSNWILFNFNKPAGFFPGAVYLLSQWDPPKMTQFRMSLLYCAAAMSGAFSGLLAAAIAKMSGIAGYNGWRWIFITEGILTVLSEDEIRYLNFMYQKYRGGHVQQNEPQREWVPAEKTNRWMVLGSVLTDCQIFL
ncbi:unnamed protein product [Clonostachys rhizophaga]|uniref:WW domain-containing protein n=1 Tax=Clonostachys rhizophaga TaxID=160324 RepID=A0A9N9V4U2_9HYPO|nr:unnamed protein product [Clonostachys rhizophaga]